MKRILPYSRVSSVFLLGLLPAMTSPCLAQGPSYTFEGLFTEQGLSHNSIQDIVQDHQGYIWLGTEDGLLRYNGYELQNYSHDPDDSLSLSQNRVEKLFVDFKGDLWVGSNADLDRYSPACDCFIRYASYPFAPANEQVGQINAFVEDLDHNLWIGTQNGGLFRYERECDEFTRFLNDPTDSVHLLDDEVRVLAADRNHQLWIGTGEPFDAHRTGGGLIRLDLVTGKTKRFLHDPFRPNSLVDNRISAIYEDKEGTLWAGSCQSGLHAFDPEKEEFVRMGPDNSILYAPQGEMGLWSSCPHVRFIHQDADGAFWVGTYNGGINHFDPVSGQITRYSHKPGDSESLASDQVWSFLQDSQDRLWIGNLPGGLHKLDPFLHKFTIHTHDPENPESLSAPQVMGVYEAPDTPGIIWLGTRGGGLNRLDLQTGTNQHFRHDSSDDRSISSDIVWTSFEDSNGTFWVGTEAGLDTMSRQTGQFIPYGLIEDGVFSTVKDPIIRIHEDQNGNMWLGTWSGGIIRIAKDRLSHKRYHFSTKSPQSYYNSVFDIHEGGKGKLWIGVFQGGLFEYDPFGDYFLPHLQAYGVTCMQGDGPDAFWIGTTSSGLLNYNTRTGKLKQFTTADGMASNTINGIQKDSKGHYWLATGNGIIRFEPTTFQITNFDESDGLSVSSFNHIGAFKSLDGHIFFGGAGGLVSFDPNKITNNPYPPEVILTGMQASGEPMDLHLPLDVADTKRTLSHWQNDLTFNYVGLHYTYPSKNQYKYRMIPYDSEWIAAGTQRTARYTNLDPGQYTFQVIASSSDGVWNERGAYMQFEILPPWWTRWWAYILFSGILLGFSRWFYRFKVSRKLAVAESKRLLEIDHFKSSLYTNITHEFRTPLTVILGLTDTLQSKGMDYPGKDIPQALEMIQRNGRNLLQLVNEMLDLAKLESGHLELELRQKDVIPFIFYIGESFQNMAAEKQIDYTIETGVEELIMDVDSEKLAVIVSNLLSNAIKFTSAKGAVMVRLDKISSLGAVFFLLQVADTGIGIHPGEIPYVFDRFYQADHSTTRRTEGTGIGLALTKELVELMGGTIQVESTIGQGTRFSIRIPITREASIEENPVSQFPAQKPAFNKVDAVSERILEVDLPLVLIIEDNLDLANYLKIALKDIYNCQHAGNGELGVRSAFEHIPDIVICDVMMPIMDGFDVCATLKADQRTDHIPVIMLTALAENEARLKGLSTGADAYLSKPFVLAELMIRLEKLLEVRKTLQKKYSRQFLSSEFNDLPLRNTSEFFLVKAEKAILEHLKEDDFSVDQLADALCLSRSQVHRKIKALTGYATTIYIRSIRLQKAKELLAFSDLTVAEIAYEVGFKSPVYFSQIFKKTFGDTPTENRL